jgi:hypothetical protein
MEKSTLNERIYIRVAAKEKEQITTYCNQERTTISKDFREYIKKRINKNLESFNNSKTENSTK